MNSKFWMSLAILAALAIAGPVRGQHVQYVPVEQVDRKVQQISATSQALATQPEGYRMTVELLSEEALKIAATLYQTGSHAEAEHLLQRVLQLNPQDQRVKQALARIWMTAPARTSRTPAEISRCLQLCEQISQQCPQGQCPATTTENAASGRCVGVLGTYPSDTAPAGATCIPWTPCFPMTVNAEAVCACGEKCPCKKECACGPKCPCKPASAEARADIYYHVLSVPGEIAHHCPVLNGRVKFITRPSRPMVWVHQPAAPVRVHRVAAPVSRFVVVAESSYAVVPAPQAVPSQPRVVEVRSVPVPAYAVARPVVEVQEAPWWPQPVEVRAVGMPVPAPRVEATPQQNFVTVWQVEEDEEGRAVITQRVVAAGRTLWQVLSRNNSEPATFVIHTPNADSESEVQYAPAAPVHALPVNVMPVR